MVSSSNRRGSSGRWYRGLHFALKAASVLGLIYASIADKERAYVYVPGIIALVSSNRIARYVPGRPESEPSDED